MTILHKLHADGITRLLAYGRNPKRTYRKMQNSTLSIMRVTELSRSLPDMSHDSLTVTITGNVVYECGTFKVFEIGDKGKWVIIERDNDGVEISVFDNVRLLINSVTEICNRNRNSGKVEIEYLGFIIKSMCNDDLHVLEVL